jgi:hypothetical protein
MIRQTAIEETLVAVLVCQFMVYMIIVRFKFKAINEMIVPIPEQNLDYKFTAFQVLRDPWLNMDLRAPDYVLDPVGEKGSRSAHKHEKLFWFNTPSISILILQFLYISILFWTEVYAAVYWNMGSIYSDIWFGIAMFVMLISSLFILPNVIQRFTIIANIEMMKDPLVLELVATNNHSQMRKLYARLYRLLKSDSNKSKKAVQPKEHMETLLRDSFNVLSKDESEINISDLPALGWLCGNKLEQDELVLMANENSQTPQPEEGADEKLNYTIDDFLTFVNQKTNEIKLDPAVAAQEAIHKHMFTQTNNFIQHKELRHIIENYKVMEKEDINRIMAEMKYVSWGDAVELDNLSANIRNVLEGMPR